jgi:hypothetical protein
VLSTAGALLLFGASWQLLDSVRDPYEFTIARDYQLWRSDEGLRRAMVRIRAPDRNLLRLWMIRYASQAHGTRLRARTIRDAVDEISALARDDSRLSAAIELYTAPSSSGLAIQPRAEQNVRVSR